MALDMNRATNARNKGKLGNLKTDFNSDLQKIISRVSGSKYDAVVKAVKDNWTGADADDFLRDLDKSVSLLKKQIRELKENVNKTLDTDYNEFVKFQQRNVR